MAPRKVPATMGPRRKRRNVTMEVLGLALALSGLLMFFLSAQVQVTPVTGSNQSPTLIGGGSTLKPSNSETTRGDDPVIAASKVATPTEAPLIPDGTFNSIPVYYKDAGTSVDSTYNCVGENFRDDAWLYRSCSFRNLCFDLEEKTFVLFQSPQDDAFWRLATAVAGNDTLLHLSTTGNQTLSLGGINPKWRGPRNKLRWFPQIRTEAPKNGYYELPADTVWVPFHSFAGYNVGHLIWDDFFPIFKLLTMFELFTDTLVLTRVELKLWGTCDWNPKNTATCKGTFAKFLPAMGLTNESVSSTTDVRFTDKAAPNPRSNFVCAPRGAAGLGMLTDHGFKMHGWDDEDYETTHNAGRGKVFYDFRSFMLRNLGVDVPKYPQSPYKVVFSRFSSSTKGRVKGFGKQEKALKDTFPYLNVAGYRMGTKSLHEQALIASEAAIYVTAVGGGAMTATFLPRGATLILYYEATGGRKRNADTGRPARLDWDVLNHASHLRVHWLPIETLDEAGDLQLFVQLVRHELALIEEHHKFAKIEHS